MSKEQKILIVDDSEMNRAILADILGGEYEIIEAENGVEGVANIQKYGVEISLVLLDVVMPQMDGFGVLEMMHQHRWIEDIPVIMISSESGSAFVERAYEMGVSDFISRPFDALVVHRRVVNTILLYAKQKRLISMVAEQIYEKEQQSSLMIDILSHIVEFRNGESGLHVRHVHMLTELLLNRLVQMTDRYPLTHQDIALISTASALHDIGKISIDEAILNKPGRLTDAEFKIMKSHSRIGAEMLKGLADYQGEPLVRTAYEICRWHHERYDGRGYPDGLKGDEIPISAQIVAIADVYDALTSERVYKSAYSHETAIRMILNGECGAFNPLVLDCLTEVSPHIQEEMLREAPMRANEQEMSNLTREMMQSEDLAISARTLQLLEREREKYTFFAAMSQEIQFEYNISPPMLTLSPWGAERLGMSELIMDPANDPQVMKLLGRKVWEEVVELLHHAAPEDPVIQYDLKLRIGGDLRWHRVVARAMWSPDEPREYQGAIGKAIDIHDSRLRLEDLERAATHDAMTGLLNHASARKLIVDRLDGEKHNYALVIFDLDHFKDANDTYGHMFGDEVLKLMADKLRQSVRGTDIAARVGGDEFLLFIRYLDDATPIITRIFGALIGQYEEFTISVSMGVSTTQSVSRDYDDLFRAADQALYAVKRSGRGQFRFYDESMSQMLSVISPIDREEDSADTQPETATTDNKE